ncbi:hypothetical protein LINPERHAP1_LOCUS4269 [Linum perenne]
MDSSASTTNHQFNKQENGRTVGVDSEPISVSSNNGRKITRQDIEMVQNLIERCLQLYMNKNEVVTTLLEQARIEPGFTSLVWHKLQDENAEFFKAYSVRLMLKEQIDRFNHLLERQCQLMNYPSSQGFPSHQNGVSQSPCAVTSLPVEHGMSGVPSTVHLAGSLADCEVVNGIPASGSFHQLQLNPGKEMMTEGYATVTTVPPSVTSNGGFSHTAAASLDSLVPNSCYATAQFLPHDLHLGVDGSGRDYRGIPVHSFPSVPSWNLSFPDFENGHLENYSGSDMLADSAEDEHDMVEEFFVDSDPPLSPQIEEKPEVGPS